MRLLLAAFFSSAVSFVSAQTFDVDTLQYNGSTNKHINLVLLGDGYLSNELSFFRTDAQKVSDALMSEKPFSNYKNYFNIFLINVPSKKSGAAMHPDSLIDNYYGSTFWYAGIERLLVPVRTSKISSVLAENFPAYDEVLMLVNCSKYGGSGGWIATLSTHSLANELAFHELGHSFPSLRDEYWAGKQYAREGINMTQEANLSKLKWKNWHGSNAVGLFPHSESQTWYRPHQNCKMRYLGSDFCSVCTEGIIEKIHSIARPLKSYNPINTSNIVEFPVLFELNLIKPTPNTLKSTWFLNNSRIASNTNALEIYDNQLSKGLHELKVIVEDTTGMLRVDNHVNIHFYQVTWNLRSNTSGISAHSNRSSFSVEMYPNPAQSYLTLNVLGNTNSNLSLKIFNLNGEVQLYRKNLRQNINSINIEQLRAGVYIVQLYINNEKVSRKKLVIN